jgi:toxin ParE1/3/4
LPRPLKGPRRAARSVSKVHLTERAARDLFDIYLYGIEEFGRVQADRYQRSLDHCFELLAAHPGMGRAAPKIGPAIRRHEHRSHVILYREYEDGVLIAAVVHGRSVRRLKL